MVIANHVSVSRRTFLDQATDRLRKAGIEEARKEARLLIEAVADISIAHQLAFPDNLLSDKQLAALDEALAKRELAYRYRKLSGRRHLRAEFCSHKDTLTPRPGASCLSMQSLSTHAD